MHDPALPPGREQPAPEDPTIASIAAKSSEGATATVNIDHSTVIASRSPGRIDAGIQSNNKYGVKTGTIIYHVTNSIIDATQPVSVQAPYLASDVHVSYCDLVGTAWPGLANLSRRSAILGRPAQRLPAPRHLPLLGKASPDSPLRDLGYYQSAAVGCAVHTFSRVEEDPQLRRGSINTGGLAIACRVGSQPTLPLPRPAQQRRRCAWHTYAARPCTGVLSLCPARLNK